MKALVVDDNAENRYFLHVLLTAKGYEVLQARNGEEALEIVRASVPQLVISDILMPVMDGFALCRALKTHPDFKRIPFIFYTAAYTDPKDQMFAMSVGADEFLVKPFEPHLFMQRVEEVVSKHQAPRVPNPVLLEDEVDYFRQHNERLIAQLQYKLEQIESSNQQLQQEIEERKRAEEAVRHMAFYDSLTTLPNRILFRDHLHAHIQQNTLNGQNKRLAVLLMDINHFKDINDTLGYHNGDQVLQDVGRRLQQAFPGKETVARLGGDEFVVLLPEIGGLDEIEIAANKTHKCLEPPFNLEGLAIDVEASIGAALYPDHGEDAEILLRHAEIAMYRAKGAGSAAQIIYDPLTDHYNPERLALMGELRHGIRQDQLMLYYQPKVNMQTGELESVEALVRWQHPTLGHIVPGRFIPLAEHTGLISPLTKWVLNAALAQCALWIKSGFEIHIAVNLSARNLHDMYLPQQVARLLTDWQVPAHMLVLEITESAIMVDPTRALNNLKQLHGMGMRLSIDDFGTGYSSLSYLRQLPIQELKIDQSFVKDMTSNKNDAMIVRSIIDLAHNLDLTVIAEGVETQDLWQQLSGMGCDVAQGYYMSPALPPEQLLQWIKQSP